LRIYIKVGSSLKIKFFENIEKREI